MLKSFFRPHRIDVFALDDLLEHSKMKHLLMANCFIYLVLIALLICILTLFSVIDLNYRQFVTLHFNSID